jgi:hypothetical protein
MEIVFALSYERPFLAESVMLGLFPEHRSVETEGAK